MSDHSAMGSEREGERAESAQSYPSLGSSETMIERYDSLRSTYSIDGAYTILWPAHLNLRSSQQTANTDTTLRPISEQTAVNSEPPTTPRAVCDQRKKAQQPNNHPTPLLIPKPTQQPRRKSAEAPQVVTDWDPYTPYTPTGQGCYRKDSIDPPSSAERSEQNFKFPFTDPFVGAIHNNHDEYDDQSPSAKDIPFPWKQVPKKNNKRLFGLAFVLLVALAAFLIGGGIGGGIAAAVVGRPQAPIIKTITTTPSDSQKPGNITSPSTCLCCSALSPLSSSSSSTSTYISALHPQSLFNLNCSSDLSMPGTTISTAHTNTNSNTSSNSKSKQSRGAPTSSDNNKNSGSLTGGNFTTSLSLCMDLCASWNADAGTVKQQGRCAGVTWMVDTGEVTGGNLVCVLKGEGVGFTGWTGGAKGISALVG